MGTTVNGFYDLVTGPLAGAIASGYDIDGGITSFRSPNIVLPAERDMTLSFSYNWHTAGCLLRQISLGFILSVPAAG